MSAATTITETCYGCGRSIATEAVAAQQDNQGRPEHYCGACGGTGKLQAEPHWRSIDPATVVCSAEGCADPAEQDLDPAGQPATDPWGWRCANHRRVPVRLTIRESRTTTVTFEIDEALVADPAEHRCNTLRAMLAQPATAVLSGHQPAAWGPTTYKILKVQTDYAGETYEERA